MRGSGATGIEQLVHARAHGQLRQLDDTRLEDEIGAVALAEPQKDPVPAGRLEAHGSRLDHVGPADLHVLHEVASRGVGHDLPALAAGRQDRRYNGALHRGPVRLDDASLKCGGSDPLSAEWTRGQAQRESSDGEHSRGRAHPLGASNFWNRGYSRSVLKLGSTCTLRKRTWYTYPASRARASKSTAVSRWPSSAAMHERQ